MVVSESLIQFIFEMFLLIWKYNCGILYLNSIYLMNAKRENAEKLAYRGKDHRAEGD